MIVNFPKVFKSEFALLEDRQKTRARCYERVCREALKLHIVSPTSVGRINQTNSGFYITVVVDFCFGNNSGGLHNG